VKEDMTPSSLAVAAQRAREALSEKWKAFFSEIDHGDTDEM
jgi:hypothetical protein